ncbi:MAG TPA: type I-E CRISPR-associated protein Cas7/Cse4/CasC [Clostridiales bacterium]|jgi:CRISPR system Cascade subunit CasC|nr:type I-E CRISPR-associated protein Cas7/Cse4/CasC [Clostridiales bacterium]
MLTNDRVYVDVHVLQTVPPSCVNRDDTGSPKTAIYGGAVRARVSSQSWKKAMRDMFKDIFPTQNLGVRTKLIVKMVSDAISQQGGPPNSEEMAIQILKNAGLNIKSAEKGTDALFFMSYSQANALAKLALEDPDTIKEKVNRSTKNKIQAALRQSPGVDIALFGRMVADDPSLNTDACAQVAHSISTHRVSNEYDYFTAVDDLSPEDSAGAGHIGTVEFNSSTLYRYATVAVHQLYKELKEDTAKAVQGFIRAFVCSMPTGKQNTFANRTLPDALLVTLRTDQPINLVGAFEKPVNAGRNNEDGFVSASAKALVDHTKKVYGDWLKEPDLALVTGDLLSELGDKQPFENLLDILTKEIENRFDIGGDEK